MFLFLVISIIGQINITVLVGLWKLSKFSGAFRISVQKSSTWTISGRWCTKNSQWRYVTRVWIRIYTIRKRLSIQYRENCRLVRSRIYMFYIDLWKDRKPNVGGDGAKDINPIFTTTCRFIDFTHWSLYKTRKNISDFGQVFAPRKLTFHEPQSDKTAWKGNREHYKTINL